VLKIVLSLLLLFVHVNAACFELNEQINLLFFGAFVMIIVYNLGYFIFTKNSAYETYFAFHITVFLIMLFYTDMIEDTWFDFNIYGVPVGIFFLSVAMFLAFSRDFLELKNLYQKIENYFNKLIILNLGLLALSAFAFSNVFLETFCISLVILEAIGLLIFSAYLGFKNKNIYARFYFYSFSPLFITLIFVFLSYFDIIGLSENTHYLFEIAILLEATGFSFALAYQSKETTLNLEKNELLFKELSHRVQNNLQQIISILTLQMETSKNLETKENLEDTINRINSISLIHKTLQNSSNLGKINIYTYLKTLIEGYESVNTKVAFSFKCAKDIELDISKLTPLAIILNELITNSVKHAFKEVDNAQIHIKLEENKLLNFTYKDNGSGFNKETTTDSLGTILINILSKSQLKGQVDIDSEKHYFFSLEFSR